MDIEAKIRGLIQDALTAAGISVPTITLEHPADLSHGDYSTNVALIAAKGAKADPCELATHIVAEMGGKKPSYVEAIEVAGPGFINFHLSRAFFTDSLRIIKKAGDDFGTTKSLKGQKYLIEYTDPNPFKEFHIGHLMSNAIGESLSRLFASQGAKVKRMCYQGDVGPHVARALWGMKKNSASIPGRKSSLSERTAFLGRCYAEGSTAYEEDVTAKGEIDAINKAVYEKSGRDLLKLYKRGRKWSLEKFEEIYKILGTKFDYYILESEVMHDGVALVEKHLAEGVFEKSDGAKVFKGEKYDTKLHTRVFINSQGLPTYEAKELGLNVRKWNKIRPDRSIIITANEQADYFRVVLKALELIVPEVRAITEHISHGMLRFADGKMSSRKGKVITGESLIQNVEALVETKLEGREMKDVEKKKVAEIIAVSAIKYSILKQVTSGDIIYDFDKSISFEGDSGPYLLYSAVRAHSILEKAKKEGVKANISSPSTEIAVIEKMLYRFPEVVARAVADRAPHHIATYLIELSAEFNSWYANTQIVNKEDASSPYRVALTEVFSIVSRRGLDLLGIRVPERM
jgi:arginyl-tRNA synthetase